MLLESNARLSPSMFFLRSGMGQDQSGVFFPAGIPDRQTPLTGQIQFYPKKSPVMFPVGNPTLFKDFMLIWGIKDRFFPVAVLQV